MVGRAEASLSVRFTDRSIDAPTDRLWTLGDGSISTGQHPVHVHTAEGTFAVTLTATNAAGADSETKADLISVMTGYKVFLPLTLRAP